MDYSIPDRNPPIRFRANIPTTWLSLELTEGKKQTGSQNDSSHWFSHIAAYTLRH